MLVGVPFDFEELLKKHGWKKKNNSLYCDPDTGLVVKIKSDCVILSHEDGLEEDIPLIGSAVETMAVVKSLRKEYLD
jgi:tetrahydromethanopterin S-methyltransferase subunit B